MRKSILFAVTILLTLFSISASAKDLTHRFGIGLKNNTSEYLPSVAGVYFQSADLAITGGFGIDTKKDYAKSQIHVGVRKMIYAENNLNFYSGAQVGFSSFENPFVDKQSGLELLGVFGVEFFFQGLENLGFTFEAGFGVASANETRLRTVADDPTRAGIIFYF